MDVKKLKDPELYQLCQEYGQNAQLWKRKFAGLLPEVKRRRLYRRRGYASIHEFAAKLGGMSHASVDKVLNLSRKLKDKPTLRAQLESGEHGWSKIQAVAYIATPKNEKEWAQKVAKLSKAALENCVQNYRLQFTPGGESQPEKRERLSFEVNDKTALKFRQLKQKIEKKRGETLSFGEVLEALLTEKPQQEAKVSIQVCPDCTKERARKKTTRAIPVNVKRLIRVQQEDKCQNCNHPIEEFHHRKRFALKPDHDPDFMVGLCKKCHKLEHCSWQIDQKVLNYRLPVTP